MNKTELIAKVHDESGGKLTKAQSELAVDSLLTSISKALAAGEDISLVGFGAFKTMRRAERKGRNPQTGEELTIPASTAVKFTPGKSLKAALN